MSIFQVITKPEFEFLAQEESAEALAIENKFRQLLVDYKILLPEHLKDGDAATYFLWSIHGRIRMDPDILFLGQQTEDNAWLTALAGSTTHLKNVVPKIKTDLRDFICNLPAVKARKNRAEIKVDVVLWNEKGKYA